MQTIPALEPRYQEQISHLLKSAEVQAALAVCETEAEHAIEEQVHLAEIESPTFAEQVRGEEFARLLREYGLTDIEVDKVGNVIGRRKGTNPDGPVLAIAAHLDTVFPAGTPLTVRREGNRLYGPGIGDNASGLRSLLQTLRALEAAQIETQGDILFVGTVGEEGNGDIRGSKALFDGSRAIDGFMALDMADVYTIQSGATGSHRWRLAFEGQGGHSYLDYGRVPSAIHAMCRAGALIADLELPEDPKTTYTIGTIKGGTTVNTIAARCEVDVDMRSVDLPTLEALEAKILGAFEEALRLENAHWPKADADHQLKLVKTQIGNRPAGMRPADCPAVQSAMAAMVALSLPIRRFGPSSTDANMPMSLGIPSVCIGTGGETVSEHSLKEYFVNEKIWLGSQLAVLIALSLVGTTEVAPTLPRR